MDKILEGITVAILLYCGFWALLGWIGSIYIPIAP
jgi:hypothetical protein